MQLFSSNIFLSQLNTEGNFFYFLGHQETAFAVGYEGGATLMGALFHVNRCVTK